MIEGLPPDDLPDIRLGDTVRKPRGTVVWTVTRVERYERHAVAYLRASGKRNAIAFTHSLVLLDRDAASLREVPPWAPDLLLRLLDQIAYDAQQQTAIDVDPIDVITERGWRIRYAYDVGGTVFIVPCDRLIVADPATTREQLAERISYLIDNDRRHAEGD